MPTTSHNNGYVYLIGAGPGDPGLITVRGRECIGRAEVILYDYLANEELLRMPPLAPNDLCRQGGRSPQPRQSQINELLVRKALEGRVVARLKGGDPFVFGRGGEECEALVAHRIPFEIVPGVTAGIGARLRRHPPHPSGLHHLRRLRHRHEGHDKDISTIDWERLSLGSGTLVFYMGSRTFP